MKIDFDPAKDTANIKKHGFSLNVFSLLDFSASYVVTDDRRDYGEERIKIFAPLNGRVCVAVFTERDNVIRVISLRKANKREQRFYETQRH